MSKNMDGVCHTCGEEVQGDFIVCAGCQTVLCRKCVHYWQSGYCDHCLAAADDEEATCSVVDTLEPGLTFSVEEAKLADQPVGAVACSVKLDVVQSALSLFVTDTV